MASDPSKTKRAPAHGGATAAIEPRGAGQSLELDELLALARQRSREGRTALFDTVRDLLFDTGQSLTDRERALMGDILRRLVFDVEVAVRRDLAERLARDPRAPRDLVRVIAEDDILVAYPILVESSVLEDTDLIEIIRNRTQSHQLAIAARRSISADVSEALVSTGSEDVVVALLNNQGAQISAKVMEYLVEQSRQVDRLQEPLVRRHDLPRELARNLYLWVSAALRHHLASQHGIDGEVLDETIESTAREQFGDRADDRDLTIAERITQDLHVAGKLNEIVLLQFLKQGEIPLFEAGLACLLDLRPKLVRRILFEPGPEALALACKAAGFKESTFKAVLRLARKATRRRDADVEVEVVKAAAIFRGLKSSYAKTVTRRWRRDPQYQYALNKLEAAD